MDDYEHAAQYMKNSQVKLPLVSFHFFNIFYKKWGGHILYENLGSYSTGLQNLGSLSNEQMHVNLFSLSHNDFL